MTTLVIVGAGCSGSLVAIHLLEREAPPGARVLLFERSGAFGPGRAYATRDPDHRLNVPAGCMSAFEDRPDHFLEWAQPQEPDATARCFLPRRLFGAYLRDLLEQAAQVGAARGVVLERRAEAVTAIGVASPGRLRIGPANATSEEADVAVLALGNLPPAPSERFGSRIVACKRYVADPYAPGALALPPDEPVLLLGTGLTMLDAVATLARNGHRAAIHAVSRRGLVSRPHRPALDRPPPRIRPEGLDHWPRTARGLLRALREELTRLRHRGTDWREGIAALRADTPALWQSLPLREQRRFLEHLRPWWDAHRHRSAPETALAFDALHARRQLGVLAARIGDWRAGDGGIEVELRLRRGGTRTLQVGCVVDCTGACSDLSRSSDPLLRRIFADGVARPDALALGLDADDEGALLDRDGRVQRRLFTLGPLRRGRLWETTAVPEIRVQAERLAVRIGALVGGG